jgi:hypothetical protein
VNASEYLHIVKEIRDGKFKIGNARGKVNGWVEGKYIYGKVTKIED